jgi:hypothetical protein
MLRALTPIIEGKTKRLRRLPIPPPPKIAWLALDQLVIDDEYQRELSDRSVTLIRKLVETWDWNAFKPLSVAAAGDGKYEIVDGQHTAIAAVTHGSIESLPCLVLPADTVALKAKAFVGINSDRIALTPFALYRARVAAGDDEAVAVELALSGSGATMLERLQPGQDYPVGTVVCVSTLLQLVRRGGRARVHRLLKIAIDGGIGPIPSALLKGLELITTDKGAGVPDAALIQALISTDPETLAEEARAHRQVSAANSAEAWAHVIRTRVGIHREAA